MKELDRSITLCNRTLNLYTVICSQMNAHFKTDLEYVISKMESSTICYLVEVVKLLRVIQQAHAVCSQLCVLTDFSQMLVSVVESDQSTADQNRVNQWIRREMYTLSSTGMYNRSSKVTLSI